MSCSVNRWGTGTTCERPSNSEAAKELQARIAAMSQERAKQDMMWNSSTPASDTSSPPVTTSTAMASKPATKNSDTR
jgi:hypothetical protein